jgi:hypothetical protein
MKKQFSKFLAVAKRHKVLSSLLLLLLILAAWWGVGMLPKPLNDGMEYLGKEDYGCWPTICDSAPGTSYYYATDMTPQEIADAFTRAKVTDTIQLENSGVIPGSYNVTFSISPLSTDGKEFTISFLRDGQKITQNLGFRDTGKKYIIEIDAKDYYSAKNSL